MSTGLRVSTMDLLGTHFHPLALLRFGVRVEFDLSKKSHWRWSLLMFSKCLFVCMCAWAHLCVVVRACFCVYVYAWPFLPMYELTFNPMCVSNEEHDDRDTQPYVWQRQSWRRECGRKRNFKMKWNKSVNHVKVNLVEAPYPSPSLSASIALHFLFLIWTELHMWWVDVVGVLLWVSPCRRTSGDVSHQTALDQRLPCTLLPSAEI